MGLLIQDGRATFESGQQAFMGSELNEMTRPVGLFEGETQRVEASCMARWASEWPPLSLETWRGPKALSFFLFS